MSLLTEVQSILKESDGLKSDNISLYTSTHSLVFRYSGTIEKQIKLEKAKFSEIYNRIKDNTPQHDKESDKDHDDRIYKRVEQYGKDIDEKLEACIVELSKIEAIFISMMESVVAETVEEIQGTIK